MNEIEVFSNSQFGKLPILKINDKLYFAGSETARMLGYKDTHKALKQHTKIEGWVKHPVLTNGGIQETVFISEGNLYRLITHSKLSKAEEFEKWIFEEILPMIRQHGAYITKAKAEEILKDPDTIIRLAVNVKEGNERIALLEEKYAKAQPKIIFADAVDTSENTILVRELAKLLNQNGHDIGEKRLFQWLRENKYLISGLYCTDYNMPTQKSMNLGLFEVKEYVRRCSEGWVTDRTTKVTGKGQIYFINKFNKMRIKYNGFMR